MTRDEFMDIVYNELHSDGDNYRANRIIDAADEYVESEKEYEAIKAIPSAESKWIPVSEWLPKDSNEYLVSVIDEDVETYKHTGIAWYAHSKDYDVEEGEWRELMIDEKVIAWMPLPKPYEPLESEEK